MLNHPNGFRPGSTFMISQDDPVSLRPWHGTSASFSKTLSIFYAKDLLSKQSKSPINKNLLLPNTVYKESQLAKQVQARRKASQDREIGEKWEEIMKKELENYNGVKIKYQDAAKIIQKHARRFLAALKTDKMILDRRKQEAAWNIHDMSNQADKCLFYLGSKTVEAAITLQRAFKRFLVRKHLLVLRRCFDLFCSDKEEKASRTLRRALRTSLCKQKVKYLKFLKYREERLIVIKEKIAILSIKKYWRQKRLSFIIIKKRLQRIKQRKAAMQNKEMYQKYLASLNKNNNRAPSPTRLTESPNKSELEGKDENIEDSLEKKEEERPDGISEDEFKEAKRIQAEIQRRIKEKVRKGKISHSVDPSLKEVTVLPVMQERAIKESLENLPETDVESRLHLSTASVFAKGRSLSRDYRPKTRNLLISSPPVTGNRSILGGRLLPPIQLTQINDVPLSSKTPCHLPSEIEHANFMTSTISFMTKIDTHDDYIPKKSPRNRTKSPRNLKIKLEALKEKRKTRKLSGGPIWIPAASFENRYTLGLDNTSFTPKIWKPLPLDKALFDASTSPSVERRSHNSSDMGVF